MKSKEHEDRVPIGEIHNQEKSLSAKLDGRLVFLIKMATIDTGLTAQLLIKALLTGFVEAYDGRVSGPPSAEPLMVQFPWFPLGTDLRTYREDYRRGIDQWLQEIVDRGYAPDRRLHFKAHESREHLAASGQTERAGYTFPAPDEAQVDVEEGKALGREWALKEKNLPYLMKLITLYDQVSPEQYPPFIEGVREVVSAFEKWDNRKTA